MMTVQDLERILEERDLTREEVLSLWEEGNEEVIKYLRKYRAGVIGLPWFIECTEDWMFETVIRGKEGWIHPKTYTFKGRFVNQVYYLRFTGQDAEELRNQFEAKEEETNEVQTKRDRKKVIVKVKTRVGVSFGETYIEYYTQDPVYDLFRLLGQATDSRRLNDLINILESSEFHFGTEWAREKEKELARLLDLEEVEVETEIVGSTKFKEDGWHLLLVDKPLFVYKDIDVELLELYIDELEKEFERKMIETYGREEMQ